MSVGGKKTPAEAITKANIEKDEPYTVYTIELASHRSIFEFCSSDLNETTNRIIERADEILDLKRACRGIWRPSDRQNKTLIPDPLEIPPYVHNDGQALDEWLANLNFLLDNPPVDCHSIWIDGNSERIIFFNPNDPNFDNLDYPVKGECGIVEVLSFATARKINCK